MRKGILIISLLIGIILISGCANQSSGDTKAAQVALTTNKAPSELALQTSDLPTDRNWSVMSKVERVRSDIGDSGKNAGWKAGYFSSYRWIKDTDNLFLIESILYRDYVSIYPLVDGKINTSVDFAKIQQIYPIGESGALLESWVVKSNDQLSNPNIGDQSIAWRVYIYNEESDLFKQRFGIQFSKKDVYHTLEVESASGADYEALKEVAHKLEERI